MTNHIHMVVEVGDIPISKIIQSIFSYYVREHNRRFKKIGRLFQDRFKAKLISEDDYFLELCHYIHNNPKKAGLCNKLNDYPWSSHLSYSKIKKIHWLTTSHLEDLLKKHINAENNHYQHFINDHKNIFSKPRFFEFNDQGEIIIKDSTNQKARSEATLALENFPLTKIAQVICKHLDIPASTLQSASQHRTAVLARVLVAYYGHYHAKYYLKDIAFAFNMRPDSLSKTLNRNLKKINHNTFLKTTIKAIERKLATCDPDKTIL